MTGKEKVGTAETSLIKELPAEQTQDIWVPIKLDCDRVRDWGFDSFCFGASGAVEILNPTQAARRADAGCGCELKRCTRMPVHGGLHSLV